MGDWRNSRFIKPFEKNIRKCIELNNFKTITNSL